MADDTAAGVPAGRRTLARWFGDRSLRAKIFAAVGMTATVGAVVLVVSLAGMASMQSGSKSLFTDNFVPVREIDQVAMDMGQTGISTLQHATARTAAEKAEWDNRLAANDATFAADLDSYAAHGHYEAKVAELRAAWRKWEDARDAQLLPASRRSDLAEFARIQSTVTGALVAKGATLAAEISELETKDAHDRMDQSTSTYESARAATIIIFVIGVVVAIALALLITRAVVGTIRRVAGVVAGLAAGDLTRSAGVETRDEVGRMSLALDTAVARLRDTLTRVGGNSNALAGAAEQLSVSSARIAESADQTGTRAGSVAATSAQISHNVQAVAAGTEEMGAAIREIASSAAEAAGVTQRAVGLATTASSTITRLGDSSIEIGTVVKLITSIAEQTNLLALNATIEAARAGELGKGFAVVAGEVKDLAQATSKATEEIAERIQGIQGESTAAVAAITQVSEVIAQVDGYSATIASAVEEQSATTNEMARNVTEVATGSEQIAGTIVGVASAAQDTTAGAEESRHAAADLARMSGELQQLVGQFRV